MLVKTFEAKDMASTLKLVKEEFGPSALILSTRTLRKGALGIMGPPVTEITAAVDRQLEENSGNTSRTTTLKKAGGALHQNDSKLPEKITYEDIWFNRPAIPDGKKISFEQNDRQANELNEMRSELLDLKRLVRDLALKPKSTAKPPQPESTPLEPLPEKQAKFPPRLARLGIAGKAAEAVCRLAAGHEPAIETLLPKERDEFLAATLAALIDTTGDIARIDNGQQRLAFVGPTGVGKTTTLAKIAATCLREPRRKTVLITIDTYRIAAVEQLKVYGEIMNLPVEVVLTPESLRLAIEKHLDKDLILIDTAGRSPRDEISLQELAGFLDPDLEIQTQLVLAAPTDLDNLRETVKRFTVLQPTSLIFTKLDECDTLGSIATTQIESGMPLSYLTNGQRVPEDMLLAAPDKVADLITRRVC